MFNFDPQTLNERNCCLMLSLPYVHQKVRICEQKELKSLELLVVITAFTCLNYSMRLVEKFDEVNVLQNASPDGRYIVVGSSTGNPVIWNLETNTLEKILKGGHKHPVVCCSWNPNGNGIVSCDSRKHLVLWK
ncbi:hypothetical protein RF11_00134 [Thelohanellus kitauei]|uniref:Uncharacterized protein n=1 Tax=Thelohanellus kitauei TaxID=669202 RepID=A0A0C2N8V1_THEKT|nr:hypothetical protein RF11_00134 [Thelohanellus kitauei]